MPKIIIRASEEQFTTLSAFLNEHHVGYHVVPDSVLGPTTASTSDVRDIQGRRYKKKRHVKKPVDGRSIAFIVAEHINARPGVKFTSNDLAPVLRAEGFQPTGAASAMLAAFRQGLINGMRDTKPYLYWAKEGAQPSQQVLASTK